MSRYKLSHLSDQVLLRDLAALVARDRLTTAEMLAHIAEVDERKLYLPAAYSSMFAFCVGELRLSEDAAYKRIQAARVARRFPAIFDAVATGGLSLTVVGLLAPHLMEETAEGLLMAASGRTKAEVEHLLAERFPRPDLPARVLALAGEAEPRQLAPAQVDPDHLSPETVEGHLTQLAPAQVDDRPSLKPLSPKRYAVQFTMTQSARDKLRYAQELLGHQIPSGDIAAVLERALDALIPQLERQRFAATASPRPRSRRRGSTNPRRIPAEVMRAVWDRDGGRCTFVSESGRRCESRMRLEFDHVLEVARGGEATVDGIRLRCRAHNQYAAECTFGAEFMRHKRIAAEGLRAAADAGRPTGS